MLKKKLPVGIDNFEKLRKEDFYYIWLVRIPSDEPLTFYILCTFLKRLFLSILPPYLFTKNTILNAVPRPGALSTEIVPPHCVTISLASASPRPTLPDLTADERL